jgi:hypothetical protein
MIKVYFETAVYSELVAVIADEETYMACLPGLKKLAKSQGMFVAESLIEDRKLEDNRRRIKKNPSASDYRGTRKRLDLIHRLRKHPYVAGFMKRQLTTYHSKKKHFFKRGSVAFVSNMGDGFVRLHHGTRGSIDRNNFAVLYITDLNGKFVPNDESLDIYG